MRATRARGARRIAITDLGLFPWEATASGLAVEEFPRSLKRQPTAEVIKRRDDEHGENWDEWLQTHRVELNAMTTRQMIDWLDQQFAAHGARRVDPLDAVLSEAFAACLRNTIEEEETEKEMERLRPIIAARVATRVDAIPTPTPADLRRVVADAQATTPETAWQAAIDAAANDAAANGSPEDEEACGAE